MEDEPEDFEDFLSSEGLDVQQARLKPDATSTFRPGYIYKFEYGGESVNVLCVSTRKASNGFYRSKKGNPLVTCIKLEPGVEEMLTEGTKLILKNIVNNGRKSNYQYITRESNPAFKLLSRFFSRFKEKVRQSAVLSLFGKSNFRTYNVTKINNIYVLTI